MPLTNELPPSIRSSTPGADQKPTADSTLRSAALDANPRPAPVLLADMPPLRRVVTFLSLAIAVFLASFEVTVVSTAIPKIALEFHALSDATWITTTYMLTTTALQPLYGKLSDVFGRVPTLLFAILVFMAGSAACGWAPSMGVLVFGRALQGIGGAGLLSLVFIIISDLTTAKQRPAYLGVNNLMWTISSVIGPVLGGLLSDRASWRWVFWINLPIASVVFAVVLITLRLPVPNSSVSDKLQRVDFLGSLVLVGGVVMLLLGLTWGGKTYPWTSARVICLLASGVLALGVFILVEWRIAAEPLVPLHLLRSRNVCVAVANQFFTWMGMYAVMFYVPIWYAVVKNSSSLSLGLHMLPYLAGISIASIGAGFVVSKTGRYRLIIAVGSLIHATGCALFVLLDEHTSMARQIGFLLFVGLGLGFIIQTLIIAAQAAVSVKDMAATTSLVMFMRVLGSSIGIAVFQSMLQNAVIPELTTLAGQYPAHAQVFAASLNDQSVIYSSNLPNNVQSQLVHFYVVALQRVFIAATAFTGAAFVAVLGIKHIPLDQRNS
ncbi:hypothetical protein IWW55_004341 [Coemansia sp. RSA 2706]|nr:hypothetical protein IWW55_004341 [Coemansia sp. RSA 2706]